MMRSKKQWRMIVGVLIVLSVHASTPASKQYVDALMAILEHDLAQKINGN